MVEKGECGNYVTHSRLIFNIKVSNIDIDWIIRFMTQVGQEMPAK